MRGVVGPKLLPRSDKYRLFQTRREYIRECFRVVSSKRSLFLTVCKSLYSLPRHREPFTL